MSHRHHIPSEAMPPQDKQFYSIAARHHKEANKGLAAIQSSFGVPKHLRKNGD